MESLPHELIGIIYEFLDEFDKKAIGCLYMCSKLLHNAMPKNLLRIRRSFFDVVKELNKIEHYISDQLGPHDETTIKSVIVLNNRFCIYTYTYYLNHYSNVWIETHLNIQLIQECHDHVLLSSGPAHAKCHLPTGFTWNGIDRQTLQAKIHSIEEESTPLEQLNS